MIKNGLTPGKAFITEARRGKGKIIMLGSMPMGEDGNVMVKKLIDHYAAEAGISLRTDA
ncbi:hypothetical protein M5X11_24885 [Paenibacillus alginolyticus]|uniref:Uncharacterized protein n=1 Tax=Paenibacillus alginolyticus TaxID=59839 RepID=A0ABT4GMP9_9BACL|nr:hypothetical protein [Paenibacillus alginolyticus]MCY9668120.1 hypothetical protein [Paenibacillus alginolyticus]MCY9697478.1 hypothetical protein [Paenibacillus alginolyticus]MEC0148287.1 hypothetical protein [Paenibacillus alginolyticus]